MAFGPAWDANFPPATEKAIEIVQAAARDLVDTLEKTRLQTDQWRDEPLAEALVDSAMSVCLAQLASTNLWGRANEVPSDAFWKLAGEVLSVGRLQHRARTKPLGYAGDHQMLAWICEQTRCDDPLGRHFDRFFLNQAAPVSVRNRTDKIAASIARHWLTSPRMPYRIVSVGAGPGIDIERAAALLPAERRKELEVTLLDLDEKGLDFAKDRITRSQLAPAQVTCLRENLFRLPKRKSAIPHEGETDFLICTGLFDYLEDEAAAQMLSTFWSQLAPGGVVSVGNFAPHCPTRAYMEWIGNWYLTYRDTEGMKRLAEAASLPAGAWHIGAEPIGVNLFLTARSA